MKKKSSARELLQKLGTLMALFILVLIFCIMMPDTFPKITNIMNIFKQASINCLIASVSRLPGISICVRTEAIWHTSTWKQSWKLGRI